MLIEAIQPQVSQLISTDAELETISEGHIFTEGPVWDTRGKRLFFSDIPANTMNVWKEGMPKAESYRQPSGFSNGLTFDRQGGLIACEHGTRAITKSKDGGKTFEVIAERYQDKRLNSPNDVIAANDGSVLFSDPIYGLREGMGGPAEAELDFQGVYRLPPDGGEVRLICDSFERPNGLALSPDERFLFVNDTVRQHIRIFEIGPNWQISGGQIWAELWDEGKVGRPDGMKIDAQGNVYCVGPDGIWIFNPQADLIGRIHLPDKTSNLAWGDDDLSSLFITCSSRIFRIRTHTKGIPLV